MDVREIIDKSLKDLSVRKRNYEKYRRYYDGRHDLAFATSKFQNAFGSLFREFADNLMPAVVNGFVDNLRVEGFTVHLGDERVAEKALELWQRNFMEQRSLEVHREALMKGDAYIIVWANADGEAVIYPNRAELCAVNYLTENPGVAGSAVKIWATGAKTVRLNVYFADRIEKFEGRGTSGEGREVRAANLKKIGEIENPYGVVPVFHFANQAAMGDAGCSELENLIALNDALNKMVLDMLVSSEFGAFRQRWVTGIEIQTDNQGQAISPFTSGASGVWATDNENAKFGDFEATGLEQFVRVQESFRAEIARVASLPLHYLMLQSSNMASGRALQTAERRFQVKIKTIQTNFGSSWSRVMQLAMQIERENPSRLLTQWADTNTISDLERLQVLEKKLAIGVSYEQVLMEAGYGKKDVERILNQRRTEDIALGKLKGKNDVEAVGEKGFAGEADTNGEENLEFSGDGGNGNETQTGGTQIIEGRNFLGGDI